MNNQMLRPASLALLRCSTWLYQGFADSLLLILEAAPHPTDDGVCYRVVLLCDQLGDLLNALNQPSGARARMQPTARSASKVNQPAATNNI